MKAAGLDRLLMELFIQEVKERSSDLEHELLKLENPESGDEWRGLQERLLRKVHSLKGAAGLVEVRPVETLCHKMEDLLTFVANKDRILTRVELNLLLAATDIIAMAGDMLGRGEALSQDPFDDMLRQFGAQIEGKSQTQVGSSCRTAGGQTPVMTTSSERFRDLEGLAADRLDSLLFRSGELLATRSRIGLRTRQALSLWEQARQLRPGKLIEAEDSSAIESGLSELATCLAEDGRLLRGSAIALDQEVRRERLQPFSAACQGLARIVRDVEADCNKKVRLEIRGGEVEIDRSILAGLQDSMRHLVRNAIDHGIESPEDRRAAGKPTIGSVIVSAALFGDALRVRVDDDGRGVDVASIGLAVSKKGLSKTGDEQQLLRQVFEPGISTSKVISRLSGRGIGLDIVRKAVEGMRGTVEISHVKGGGTAFTLTLPLTVATVRAMEIMAGGQAFAIDTASVHRIIRINMKDLPGPGEPNVVKTGNGPMQVVDLAGWLGLPTARRPASTCSLPAVIVGPVGEMTAVIVEEVALEQELLVRSLGPRLAKLRYYSGATVLPDGKIALLLNAAALAEAATQENAGTEIIDRGAPFARQKVLIVDDSSTIRTLERLILEAAGYEVAVAVDGTEAWEHLQVHGADVVVADVDMPSMDGFMLTQTIRGSKDFKSLPVILLSGRDAPEDKERGLRAGANVYMIKNGFNQQHFLETVRQVM